MNTTIKLLLGHLWLVSISLAADAQHQKSCGELTANDQGYVSLLAKAKGGEHLIIHGLVVDKETQQPIPEANLTFYQADQFGEYNSVFLGMPSFAKIRGSLDTNEQGCFLLETIVPGNYPGEKDGKHIHVIADASGYKERKFEFLFEGSVSESLREEVEINGDGVILDLKRNKKGSQEVETVITLVRNK